MRFPRAIRLDNSDLQVFESVAEPGEWAVPGAFAFSDADPQDLTGKVRQLMLHVDELLSPVLEVLARPARKEKRRAT